MRSSFSRSYYYFRILEYIICIWGDDPGNQKTISKLSKLSELSFGCSYHSLFRIAFSLRQWMKKQHHSKQVTICPTQSASGCIVSQNIAIQHGTIWSLQSKLRVYSQLFSKQRWCPMWTILHMEAVQTWTWKGKHVSLWFSLWPLMSSTAFVKISLGIALLMSLMGVRQQHLKLYYLSQQLQSAESLWLGMQRTACCSSLGAVWTVDSKLFQIIRNYDCIVRE